MDSIAQQIAAWLASQGNRPRGPLVPMSAGGVPFAGNAQPSAQPQEFTAGPQVPQPSPFGAWVQDTIPKAQMLDGRYEMIQRRNAPSSLLYMDNEGNDTRLMPPRPTGEEISRGHLFRAPVKTTGIRG